MRHQRQDQRGGPAPTAHGVPSTGMSTSELPFRWRSIALPALLPSLLFSIGEGAIIPIIPLVADGLGATLALAGLVVALLTIGELAGNIPSGWLIARIGERPAVKRGRIVNRIMGDPAEQLHERHDASDFEGKLA